jgi:sulfite exporter TauE/SafE
MNFALLATAGLMGLAGGPHCLAMCGAACTALGQAAAPHQRQAVLWFLLGRGLGYGALGALSAASLQGLGWLTVHSAALRPVWTFFHVAVALLGVLLMWRAEQPMWLQVLSRRTWHAARDWVTRRGGRVQREVPLLFGGLWALLPCGLLYSALLVAALAGGALEGAMVMGVFALGGAVSLGLGALGWTSLLGAKSQRIARQQQEFTVTVGAPQPLVRSSPGAWGVRLAGLALTLTSGWALWMGLVHNQAPWCVVP